MVTTIEKDDRHDMVQANMNLQLAQSHAATAAAEVRAAQSMERAAVLMVSMAQMGMNNVMAALSAKYQLPEGCQINNATGAITYPAPNLQAVPAAEKGAADAAG